MLFNSLAYFAFFGLVLLLYWTLPPRWRLSGLLLASYVFYAYWSVAFIALILASTTIDFIVSHRLSRTTDFSHRRLLLAICVATNLLILGTFKYYDFFAVELTTLLHGFGFTVSAHILHLTLPLGISFYTFEAISYVIDVFRGYPPIRSYKTYALYIMFFPHLIAGPIVRARDIIPQLEAGPSLDGRRVAQGVWLLFSGLFVKTVLADNLAPLADGVFGAGGGLNAHDAWFGMLAFSGQIYFDFAAYTAMAQGSAYLLGFELCQNFDAPYLSPNIQQFWQRWHMSLSSWLRDYLYIPLGGSRRGSARTYLNLLITMTLGGLWHGAGWPFIIWGMLHGCMLMVHRLWQRLLPMRTFNRMGQWAGTAVTFLAVSVGWIFFRAPNLETAVRVTSALWHPDRHAHLIAWREAGVILLLLACYPPIAEFRRRHRNWLPLDPKAPVRGGLILAIGAIVWAIFAAASAQRFIYFQF
jgi:alginate O-acetyltransferase complex protein AlgI